MIAIIWTFFFSLLHPEMFDSCFVHIALLWPRLRILYSHNQIGVLNNDFKVFFYDAQTSKSLFVAVDVRFFHVHILLNFKPSHFYFGYINQSIDQSIKPPAITNSDHWPNDKAAS